MTGQNDDSYWLLNQDQSAASQARSLTWEALARLGLEVALIDDGVANRGHRKSLLDPRWRYVGIACGLHARYRTVCVMDFASSYKAR